MNARGKAPESTSPQSAVSPDPSTPATRSTRIYLVRHGEVDATWHGRVYGALDVPLSEKGRREATRAARTLAEVELAAVVSSGLSRTEHLAAELRAPRGLARRDDPELRELERGDWAGLPVADLRARFPGAWEAWFARPSVERPPGGESLGDLFTRVRPRVEHWARAHEGAELALVTHGWVIRVLVCHALGAPFELAPRLDVRTGDIIALRWSTASATPVLEAFALDAPPSSSCSDGA